MHISYYMFSPLTAAMELLQHLLSLLCQLGHCECFSLCRFGPIWDICWWGRPAETHRSDVGVLFPPHLLSSVTFIPRALPLLSASGAWANVNTPRVRCVTSWGAPPPTEIRLPAPSSRRTFTFTVFNLFLFPLLLHFLNNWSPIMNHWEAYSWMEEGKVCSPNMTGEIWLLAGPETTLQEFWEPHRGLCLTANVHKAAAAVFCGEIGNFEVMRFQGNCSKMFEKVLSGAKSRHFSPKGC